MDNNSLDQKKEIEAPEEDMVNTRTVYSKNQAQKVMSLSIYVGQLLLSYGAEIYRTQDTMTRICEAYDNLYDIDVFGLTNGILLSLEYDHEIITMFKNSTTSSLNLEKIDLINSFSRQFVLNPMNINEAMDRLKEIEEKDEKNPWTQIIFAGIASSFFALLFGADLKDFISTFFVGALSYELVALVSRLELTFFIESFIGAFASSLLAMVCVQAGLGSNIDHIIIGSIMLFVPGVAITNAVRDVMSGDFISGLVGFTKAIFVALAIAIGVGLVLNYYYQGGLNL